MFDIATSKIYEMKSSRQHNSMSTFFITEKKCSKMKGLKPNISFGTQSY